MKTLAVYVATVVCVICRSADLAAQALPLPAHLTRGIVVVVGVPSDRPADFCDWLKDQAVSVYVQSSNADDIQALQVAADKAGILGTQLFADVGSDQFLRVADNVADALILSVWSAGDVAEQELLRVLRPGGTAFLPNGTLTKPVPDGTDQWTHPYHGPDNNPQSNDKLVHGNLRTQFLGYPKFSPMPEQSVIAGGRIYKAMGHIAHKENQNEWLNTLLCINAYNGTILWRRPMPAGFMLHRNTMVATDDALYLGDDESCKVFAGETGELITELKVPEGISDGPVWKWMAIRDGVLYGLVGATEIQVDTQKSARRGLGHWPWAMWQGHEYKDPHLAFGFGRTLLAIDLATRQPLWHHREEQFLDARATCMNDHQLLIYSPGAFLAAIDRGNGELQWKNSDKDLLTAIGPDGAAQHYVTGYSTTCYIKCNNDLVFFAGPQRSRLVVASAHDGRLAWTHPDGNLQLVLRPDRIWAAGSQQSPSGLALSYSGSVLAEFPSRRACTRATGCLDSVFYRANGGTVRVFTDNNVAQHIAPMRPPCQDGVLISNGHLYWGPWMCGCQLSLYGNICLGATGSTETTAIAADEPAWQTRSTSSVDSVHVRDGDWPALGGDAAHSGRARQPVGSHMQPQWTTTVCVGELPTAPVTAGGYVFLADRRGVVRALRQDGSQVWQHYLAGAVYFPPVVAQDRVYVGSADGMVTCLAAASGEQLWSYRVAPRTDRIQVYDRLISRWPVSGGVVVHDGRVYAAAGIAHYDGTYLVALDALTGEPLAANDTSGIVSADVNNGISLQGELSIVDNELQFLAGGVYETARYDLKTLTCLNDPKSQVHSQYRTAFYPYYADYGKYLSIEYRCQNGCELIHDASYEGSQFTDLALHEKMPDGVNLPRKEAARWLQRRGAPVPKTIWEDKQQRRITAFAVSDEQLLLASHPDATPDKAVLELLKVADSSPQWQLPLPALAVRGGLALDADGHIFVSLENGQLMCFK